MSETSPTISSSLAPRRHQRSARNYLLDRSFQLKYASLLAGVVLALSATLGVLLWRTSSQVIAQGRETVERGKLVIVQSRRVNEVVAMNIAKEYKDDPVLARTFAESAASDDRSLQDEQQRLERDAVALEQHQRNLIWGLVVALVVLVVAAFAIGIVFTHKVAGPLFKMKRLLREVGDGKLVVRDRLRKGDELQHFFESFERMVDDLRARQVDEIAKVDAALEKLSAATGTASPDAEGMALLKQLRKEMQAQIEG